ncbi:MraY family glycosyltransferase [Pseudomonas sp. 22373]|uniref:MraY family glycosyltransferase n=1 Tax=Pseudomonas sp. 22373 TaxID=3453914 RepID=UPI003F847D95
MMMWPIACLVVLTIAFVATWGLRRYALASKLIDIPNARSSHVTPTPRGGGVAIVLTFSASLAWMLSSGLISSSWGGALLGAGLAVALLGFLDDHGHIAARWRLLGHFSAAVFILVLTGGFPPLEILGVTLELGWIGHIFAVFFLVWMLNLYNFMDGIDGIASVEAIGTCAGAALLYWLTGHAQFAGVPLMLAFAVGGFLIWNFPPARIFMGDAGSGFLGLIIAALAIQASWVESSLFWSWLILLGVFIVDASFTLMRRVARGEKIYEAHRSHAYQYASRRFGRHLPVTIAVLVINTLWLLPLAVAVALHWIDGFGGVLVAYAPLLVLAVFYKAGSTETV